MSDSKHDITRMSEAERKDFQDRRFLDGKYASTRQPGRLADLYPGDRWAWPPIDPAAAETNLSEESARRVAEAAVAEAATKPKPLADQASATQPRPSLSEEMRMVLSALGVAAATPRSTPRAPQRGPYRDTVDFAWVQALREEREAQFKEKLRSRWQLLPSGPRIRLLRAVAGWTQARAAMELGITRRTLIRHEQGQHRRTWMRLPLLLRLRALETTYADQILAYLDRGRPVQA